MAGRIQLKKFSMKRIPDDRTVLMLGSRGAGKSFLIKDLMWTHRDIPLVIVASATEECNRTYHGFVPRPFIHYAYSQEMMRNLIKRQKRSIRHLRREQKAYEEGRGPKPTLDPRVLLILDDVLYDKSWLNHPEIRELYFNGRHLKIMSVVTSQTVLGLTPQLRSNVDFVFVLKEKKFNNRRKLYDHYCSVFPNFDTFSKAMDATTNNFECLVIDNMSPSNDLEDCVAWYKAESHGNFRMCPSFLWDHEESSSSDEEPSSGGGGYTGTVAVTKRR